MQVFETYMQSVITEFKTGIAKEHAYRPALKTLFDSMDDILAVNDPAHIKDVGAPDYIVLKHDIPVGVTEAKDVGTELDKEENSGQMARYHKVGNVILTDYLEFRWYVDGEKRDTVRIGNKRKRHIEPITENFPQLEAMIKGFIEQDAPTITTAQELARRMAGLAQLIRDFIKNDLASDEPSSELTSQRDAFKKTLLPEMDNADFADMYAQTIAYGLFAARVEFTGEKFNRHDAARFIPVTNPFLRKLFHDMSFDVGKKINWVVDRLAELLSHTDTDAVLEGFGQKTRQEDPIVHFYEDFLREYDAKLREQRGVYYTPEPVVSYIVRSVDHILKTTFGRKKGLADKDTMILDPATGTGTFLYHVIQHIHDSMSGRMGTWKQYVRDDLLPRIFGFELLVAPYTVAHMKLGLQLRELGYPFPEDKRLQVYLTNTLEEGVKREEAMFAQYIADEANQAAQIKREKPIMVVLGNPPYSGHSANTGDWITKLHRDYYFVDGKPLGEKNPKWLQNDYVKFIRFGQWRIEQTGSGVLAFITDNSYLDSVTFRGMRQQLMQTFTDIYILDLHGNSNKKEKAPDGSADENVFDIMQGVSIVLFVKEAGKEGLATVHHLDCLGKRKFKYDWLLAHDVKDTDWTEIKPLSPYYFFIPRDNSMKPEYEQGWKITDIMSEYATGYQSHNDKSGAAIGFNKEELHRDATKFLNREPEKLEWDKYCIEVDYRPFDRRIAYLSKEVSNRPRLEIMQHLFQDNLAFNITRQTKLPYWQHALVSDKPAPAVYVEIKDGSSVFPLYLYPEKRPGEMFDLEDDGSAWALSEKGRRPNLSPAFVKDMEGRLGLRFVPEKPEDGFPLQSGGTEGGIFYPEDIFHYAYAVFHSPTYRERYAEFLKIDFPRLPLTSDVALFRILCEKGAELVQWHLMTHPDIDPEEKEVIFNISGSGEVANRYPKYDEKTKRVSINATQYFEGVPEKAWNFHIGGYQVLHKWLKDRKGRELSTDDVEHYCQIVKALLETQRLMEAIDEAIGDFPIV